MKVHKSPAYIFYDYSSLFKSVIPSFHPASQLEPRFTTCDAYLSQYARSPYIEARFYLADMEFGKHQKTNILSPPDNLQPRLVIHKVQLKQQLATYKGLRTQREVARARRASDEEIALQKCTACKS